MRILQCFVLLITFTFYNITMSIHIIPNHLLGNNKMQLVSSFLPFKFGDKGLNIFVIIFNVYSIF